jgi:hypothetical protein
MNRRDQQIAADARKPYADEIKRLLGEIEKRDEAIACLRGASKLLLRRASAVEPKASDYQAWHAVSAAEIGEVLTAARVALDNTKRFKK